MPENDIEPQKKKIPDDLFDDFIRRVMTLTRTETEVFRLHVDEKPLAEIADLIHISMNTLKTHNKNIYRKLGISSKEELTLYTSLIKRSGMEDRIRNKTSS